MTNEEQTHKDIQEMINNLPSESRSKVYEAYILINNVVKQFGGEGIAALALIGSEMSK